MPCRNVGGALSWDSHKWFSFPSSFPPTPFPPCYLLPCADAQKEIQKLWLLGEGTQVYFRKRRAWEDSQTPISRAIARALAAASRLGLRPRPTRRLHIPRQTGRPRSGCPSRGARAHPATDIRSYRTESKKSGAREKSEWKMTF